MKLAVVSICPDAKQRRLLELVFPSWQEWAARHNLPIIIIEREPRPGHVFWGKYFLFELPELVGYDAILHLDNDIIANVASPSPVVDWNPAFIGAVDEREQWGWSPEVTRAYYADYDIVLPDLGAASPIYNMGVFLTHRAHAAAFKEIYEAWKIHISNLAAVLPVNSFKMRLINDQPFMNLEILRRSLIQPLDARFNRILPAWIVNRVSAPYRPFQVQAKAVRILGSWLPRALTRCLAWPSSSRMKRALETSYFLHSAGSKSPLWMYELIR